METTFVKGCKEQSGDEFSQFKCEAFIIKANQ